MFNFQRFKEVWCVDFEFMEEPGHLPVVHCMVASEIFSGVTIKLWVTDLGPSPPFNFGSDSLCVAYMAQAELKCFKMLGWKFPTYILDLGVEFKNEVSGKKVSKGGGLLDALKYFGIPGIKTSEKAIKSATLK
jgi:DNA polymerase-1